MKKPIVLVYLMIAVVACVGCWSQNIQYMNLTPIEGTRHFIDDLTVTPASRSFTIDLTLYFLAGGIWMVREAARLKMKYVWAYLILGAFIAISVTFPLFLVHREFALEKSA